MTKFERLNPLALNPDNTKLRSQKLPELVHMDDPAYSVMIDFNLTPVLTISAKEDMTEATHEMQHSGTHLLIVTNGDDSIVGIITSEDLLGEKPIQIIQQRRVDRTQITVKMLMTPLTDIFAFDIEDIERARVGNIVATLQEHRQHHALVVKNGENGEHILRGFLSTSQISKQLHRNISTQIAKAESVSELHKRSS